MENLVCNVKNNFMLGCSGSGRTQGIVFFFLTEVWCSRAFPGYCSTFNYF